MSPEEPRDVLGDDLWDVLGQAPDPAVPQDFDAAFRARLADPAATGPAPVRGRWPLLVTGAGTAAALAAGLVLALRPPPEPAHDLALVADLEIVENLDLLRDLDVLLAWDGATP